MIVITPKYVGAVLMYILILLLKQTFTDTSTAHKVFLNLFVIGMEIGTRDERAGSTAA